VAAKDRAKRRKHGIDLRTAARVFDVPNMHLTEDRTDRQENNDDTRCI
jgi:hypothetical protein